MIFGNNKSKDCESCSNMASVRLKSDSVMRETKNDDCNTDRICETVPKYGCTQEIRVKGDDHNAGQIREAAPKYGMDPDRKTESKMEWDRQGTYTKADYIALPEECRVELIDGVFYDKFSPVHIHQMISMKICTAFANYIERRGGDCIPLSAPMDVQIERDEKTIVQPDVLIVCDREKFQNGIVYGAPDLVVEILSKSSRSRDCIIKLKKYYESGVREYWIVDPAKKEITVYRFGGGEFQSKIYDSSALVPVGIFNDACTVDFNAIFEYVSFLGDIE